MNKKLYEAELFYGINPAFIVFFIITIIMFTLLVVFRKRVDRGVRYFISFIIAFFVFILSCQVYTAIDAKNKVYDEYQSGNYLVVEGIISGYTTAEKGQANLPDYFCVDNVEFQVPGFVTSWGYPLKRDEGGVLENGMNVRICYIEYKFENVIMKIEQLD